LRYQDWLSRQGTSEALPNKKRKLNHAEHCATYAEHQVGQEHAQITKAIANGGGVKMRKAQLAALAGRPVRHVDEQGLAESAAATAISMIR